MRRGTSKEVLLRIDKKTIIMSTVLLLIAVLAIYGCRSMPPEQPPFIVEEVLPEEPHEVQAPEDAVAMTHEVEGFEDCTGCHFDGGSDGDATVVEMEHYCSACHEMAQPIPFDHGDPPNVSCTLCHRQE